MSWKGCERKSHGTDEEWPENLRGRDHLEDVGIVGRLTLKWILRKLSGRIYTGIILP
jgi:hypothetical protein